MQNNLVLVVDDEPTIQYFVRTTLESKGCEVEVADSAEAGLELLEEISPAVALVDIVLPGMSGLQMIREIKRRSSDTEILIMTGYSSAESAREAIRKGAFDYIQKPFEEPEDIWILVQRAFEKRTLVLRNRVLQEEQEQRTRELSSAVALEKPDQTGPDSRSFRQLLDFFAGLVSQQLEADRVSVMLLDPDTKELRIAAHRGMLEVDIELVRVPLGEGVAGSVAATGHPVLVANADENENLVRRPESHLSKSFISAPVILSVPIKAEHRVLGVINVTNQHSQKPFDEDDVIHLSALSAQLATAIEGVKRSQQLQRAYESLKIAQDQLVFAERIKVIGQMAAGVAHDFNNTLSVILGRAQFALLRLKKGDVALPDVRSDLETIVKSSLQGAETIKRIQDYTRIRKDTPRTIVDLNQVVNDAVEMARPKWKGQSGIEGKNIEIQMDLTTVPLVKGNPHELTQVVENLLFNAVEAMPQGGRLGFRTREAGGSVILEVSDTGIGMNEETKSRLFEPFFTTKESGQGLGTSIIYGIVTRHQGSISVDSEVGKGTTFRVKLPKYRLKSEIIPRIKDQQEEGLPPSRVLLVDDDDMVRNTFEESLRYTGHEVVAVADGEEALSRFDRGKFDAVVTDLSMGGISGIDVARAVKRLDPTVPVILLSGWSIQQQEEKVEEAGIDHVLVKPCLFEDLLATIQKALRNSGGSQKLQDLSRTGTD